MHKPNTAPQERTLIVVLAGDHHRNSRAVPHHRGQRIGLEKMTVQDVWLQFFQSAVNPTECAPQIAKPFEGNLFRRDP